MKNNLPLALGIAAAATTGIYHVSAKDTKIAEKQVIKTKAKPRKAAANDPLSIPSDERVLYGVMPNGMRYVIMRNTEPKDQVSMRLHVAAGSLNEVENQRGIAHYLEHMVFNGSKHFPDAKKLIPEMQRLGIGFGSHANAYTSFDETVYMLDLPNKKAETMDFAFKLMHDFADGAHLTKEEIDEERGIILAEKTSRDSVQMRLMEQMFVQLMPESRLAKRFPIGTEEVIKKSQRDVFVKFYEDFYTPENMTFVYVGDIDVATAEQRIHDMFGGIKPATNKNAQKASVGKLPSGGGFKTAVFADKEVAQTEIGLLQINKNVQKPDNVKSRIEKLPLSVASAIVARRFDRIAKQEGSPIVSGKAGRQVLFKELELGSIDVTAADNQWEKALPVLEQELRRAVQHGFTQGELDEVKANILNSYEQAVKSAPSRKSKSLASALAQQVHNDTVFSTPETNLKIVKAALEQLTAENCHKAFAKFWDNDDVFLTLTTQKASAKDETKLKELFDASKKNEVKPPKVKKSAAFAYTDFGPAGKVSKKSHHEKLDFTQLTFENGIRVNLKKTDFKKNSISMVARVGSGKLTQPKALPGIDMLAGAVMNAGGLGKHSADDLRRNLAGKNVGVSFGIEDDAFTLSGATTPEDLELQLQLLCANLTDPGFRPEAERMMKMQLPMIFQQLKHTEAGPQSKLSALIKGNDPRFTLPSLEQAQKLSTEQVKAWIAEPLKKDYMELSIVGDIDIDKTIALLAKTVGALPKRAASKPELKELATLAETKTPLIKSYSFDSKVEKGIAITAWKTGKLSADTINDVRRLGIVAEILSDRMRVKLREELGDAYSPGAAAAIGDVFDNSNYILAFCPAKPSITDKLSKMIIELAADMAKNGATQDELDRALKPRLASLKKTHRENSYWLGSVLSQSQEQPFRLKWAMERDEDYKNIKLDEVNALAKKHLNADNSCRFVINPEQKK